MEFGEGVHRWWCQYHLLDERSLAAMRIGLSFVLFWDLTRGWLLADDWLAMQAFDRWPLPLGQDNPATSLRCALVLLAGATTALMIGWRTQWPIFIVWFGACG